MKVVAIGAALVLCALAWLSSRAHTLASSWQARSASSPSPSPQPSADGPGTLRDPLSTDRLTPLDSAARADAGDWLSARPGFQYSRTSPERGGLAPCAEHATDTSAFADWMPLSRGHFSAPRVGALDASGQFDLVVHLHGDEPVRRELAQSQQRFVLYTLTLDPSQSYAPLFSGSGLLPALVSEIEHSLSKTAGVQARRRRLALSAWSAGFTGVEALLAQPEANELDAIILIDGLHAPRERTAFRAQLQPFVHYSALAAAGERLMIVTHSSIDPPDFASSTESAHYLIASLGGKPTAVQRKDPFGLELVEYYSLGDFHVRGYAGNDKADHCAQLALLRTAYGALGRRWHPPR